MHCKLEARRTRVEEEKDTRRGSHAEMYASRAYRQSRRSILANDIAGRDSPLIWILTIYIQCLVYAPYALCCTYLGRLAEAAP